MTVHHLGVDLSFAPASGPDRDEDFDAFVEAVMDALCDLEKVDSGLVDPDITAAIADRSISVVMGVEADTFRDAVRLFSANVRTALHAAECATPEWQVPFRVVDDDIPLASRVDFADV
ncbi:hypothetical protein [Actinoallomurus soli]|uniref:hypothetical protein n=1 Tax=Actinoallomurus soli TaxID=2952535 RepID=UPI002092B827|nr:hypothetical protein [Actinoallomurus soli]MCO5971727.1 hypothetical protein [Actinoallomurus soli]